MSWREGGIGILKIGTRTDRDWCRERARRLQGEVNEVIKTRNKDKRKGESLYE